MKPISFLRFVHFFQVVKTYVDLLGCYLVVIKIEIMITSWNISLNFNKTEQASETLEYSNIVMK